MGPLRLACLCAVVAAPRSGVHGFQGTSSLKSLRPRTVPRERVYEVCRLDTSGAIIECNVVPASQLVEEGLLGSEELDAVASQRGGDSDLLFTMPKGDSEEGGSGDQTLFFSADFATCLEEDVCDLPADAINKAFGPDGIVRLKKRREEGDEGKSAAAEEGKVVEPVSAKPSRFHIHFGAGRLGMGLVVPAIAGSGVPFAIVQRPKPRWQEIFRSNNSSTIDVTVNGAVTVRSAAVISTADECLRESEAKILPAQSLVFASAAADLESMLSKATSFSCSLGAAMAPVMTSTLAALPEHFTAAEFEARLRRERVAEFGARLRREKKLVGGGGTAARAASGAAMNDIGVADDPRPVLFCTENDHAAVLKLKTQLRSRVRVVDCMVDRVCTGRRIVPGEVAIDAEPWRGSIVVLEPGFTPRRVPFSPAIVSLPATADEAAYLSERKFTLVNGMHTVLAFLTLIRRFDPTQAGREYVLLKYVDVSRRDQRSIEAWRTARVAQLLDDFGSGKISEWTEGCASREDAWTTLLDFADEVILKRFCAIDDLVSRVLGGGVANRWQTRLIPTTRWFKKRAAQRNAAVSTTTTTTTTADEAAPAEAMKKPPAPAPQQKGGHLDRAELEAFLAFAAKRDRDRASARAQEPTRADEADVGGRYEVEPPLDAAEAIAFVSAELDGLVANSRIFCNKEVEITHKMLMKEQRKAGGKKFSPTVQKAIQEEATRQETRRQEARSRQQIQPQGKKDPPQTAATVARGDDDDDDSDRSVDARPEAANVK